MIEYNSVWEMIVCKISPKHKKLKEATREIKMETWNLKKLRYSKEKTVDDKLNALLKSRDEIVDNIIKRNKIKNEQISTSIEFDYDFLRNSVKVWDKLDYAFIFFLVAVYIALVSISEKIINDGKKTHDSHSNKANVEQRKKFGNNKIHEKMPNDKIPEGHYGIENPNGGRPGGSAKINGKSLNHRYIFGHDLFKPLEILKNIDKISNVTSILGSKKIGALVKQFYHIFYDTFSESGIPVPGSTYFLDFITQHIKTGDDFVKFFSVHIEDIITSTGVEGCIYIYHRFRQYKEGNQKLDFFDVVKDLTTIDISKRTFKEYEMGMIAHSLIIWIQCNLPNFRGKVNYNSIRYLVIDVVQYVRLNRKWNVNYKNLIISELQDIAKFRVPEDLKARYKKLCLQNNIIYNDDFLEIYESINKKLSVK